MRIESLEVSSWRNLADIRLEVPPEAPIICLVGENGAGKSNLLELVAAIAASFGLSAGVGIKRGNPLGEVHSVSATLRLVDEFAISSPIAGYDPTAVEVATDQWDHTLHFHSASPPDGHATGLRAGGVADAAYAAVIAQAAVQTLQGQPEVNELYLDSERSFPALALQDQEIWNLMRQDLKVPSYLRQQAAAMTQSMYSDWMRWMLASQLRAQSEYMTIATAAHRAEQTIPPPPDQLSGFQNALQVVLPHLQFSRLDHDNRTLYFNSAGTELRYESLSGGEREIAFLIGQIQRFQLRNGLLLIDEPELHLNPELLRRWLRYLHDTVQTGQVWIATHSLDAVEAAGLSSSFVLERSDDRRVRRVSSLADRPALQELAGALGSPAFSLARSRFILIEGERPRRERERFARVLNAGPSDRFLEAGSSSEVIRKFDALRQLAIETEQLRIGAIVDRDTRSDAQAAEVEHGGIHVLPCHEIENFLIHPSAIAALLEQAGRAGEDPNGLLRDAADTHAGRWILDHARTELGPTKVSPAIGEGARRTTWAVIAADIHGTIGRWVAADPDMDAEARSRLTAQLIIAASEFANIRSDPEQLWKRCYGKESLSGIASAVGLRSSDAAEARVLALWASDRLDRPHQLQQTYEYLASIPVLP